jgi:hypothetical protein
VNRVPHLSRTIGWRKSSRCDTNTCLEVNRANGLFYLRNSTRPWITVACTTREWETFRDAVIRGEFDDPGPDPAS